MYIDPEVNTGLPTNFVLENGAFQLIGGTEKANNTISMMLDFAGWFRVYAEDFPPDILWLLQQPVAVVLSRKTYLVGKLTKLFSKYLNQVNLESVTFDYDYADRKKFVVTVDYVFKGNEEIKESYVTYINV